jgi:hypothetical protein
MAKSLLLGVPHGLMLTETERADVLRVMQQDPDRLGYHRRVKRVSALLFGIGAISLFGLVMLSATIRKNPLILAGSFVVMQATVAAILIPMALKAYRKTLYEALYACGHNICPKCGYLRQGLEDTVPCPECGKVVSIE